MQTTLPRQNTGRIKSLPYLIVLMLMIGCGDAKNRCLVSPLSGALVASGKPVDGAKVTRRYHSHWYNQQIEEVVRTDAKGYFVFPGAWKKAVINLPHQPVIQVTVVVEYHGTNRTVLDVGKMNYDALGELWTIQHLDPEREKDRLSKQDGRLHLKFDLDLDKVPIGRSP